ncbi:uncharacterized protein JCM6883_004435 [Sporobolomyces salmoneus]|uniref:uncharacterized protein n=1 Tax=Sporobolomyces salmoneus TaxID=183962 RepID=UPI003171CA7C
MLPTQQLEHRRQRLARLQEERDSQLDPVSEPVISSPSPAPSSSTTTPPPAARSTPRRTVSSIPGEKTCWICYETSLESPSRPFIHACSCSLLVHPDCLLEWISTKTSSSSSGPKCPVCATPIIVQEKSSEFLKIYRKFVRKLHRLSIVATVGGVAASGWFVASAYGMWALRVFMGDQVARALLERESLKKIPFKLWLNLPLIPFALILSRTPLIDSLLPFLPLTLALSTHSSSPSSHYPHLPSFLSLSPLLPHPDPLGLSDLSLKFPPSPTLTICLIPWLRILYFRTRSKLFRRVLGQQKRFKGLAGMMEEAAREEQATWEVLGQSPTSPTTTERAGGEGGERRERGMRNGIELVAELEYEYVESEEESASSSESEHSDHPLDAETPQRPQRPHRHRHRQPRQQQQEDDTPAATAPDPPSSLRIGIGRLTSLLLGALLYPALSSLVGSGLFWLATRGGSKTHPPSVPIKTLRKILGISTLIASSSSASSSSVSSALSFLNPFSALLPTTTLSGVGAAGAAEMGKVVDPVWIRNTIGGGLVLVIRDALELTVGVLEKRRKESRRIVEREIGEGLSLLRE